MPSPVCLNVSLCSVISPERGFIHRRDERYGVTPAPLSMRRFALCIERIILSQATFEDGEESRALSTDSV